MEDYLIMNILPFITFVQPDVTCWYERILVLDD